MRTVTIDELRAIATEARVRIWNAAKAAGREPKIYLHWSAGHYSSFFDDYHINIDFDGRLILMQPLDAHLPHTYMRNSGSVGISLCCGFQATSNDLGPEPPTAAQIEAMAQAIVAVADGLWLTIDKWHVMTHAEAADNIDGLTAHDPYGPNNGCERWDLQYLGTAESPRFRYDHDDPRTGGNVLRGKANWYRNQWKKSS